MSREVIPRALPYLLAFFLTAFSKAGPCVLADDCAEFDIGQLEDYLSKLDLGSVPTVDTMIGGFQCPVTALPFGALKSDWARLMLLQRAQPEESIFREKLGRLFRILAIAYFRMEERFGVAESGVRAASPSRNASSTRESIVNVDTREGTKELDLPITTSGEANDIAATSISSTAVPGNGESFTERLTFDGRPATIEHANDVSGTVGNNVFNPGGTFSRADTRTAAFDTRTAITANTATPRYTGTTSDDRADDDGTDLKIPPITNRVDPAEPGLDASSSPAAVAPIRETISTTTDFTSGPSAGNNFARDYTVMNNFTADESNVSKDDLVSREESSTGLSTVELNTLTEPMGTSADSINGIPITTFSAASNISGIITYSDYMKSITVNAKGGNEEEEEEEGEGKESEDGTIKTTFIDRITTDMSNRVEVERVERTSVRGDYPLSYDSVGSMNSAENRIEDRGEESSYPTARYRNVTDRDIEDTTGLEVSTIKMTTGQSGRIPSGRVNDNGGAGSSESFDQSLANRRAYRIFEKAPADFPNSTVPLSPNKIRKPALREKVPRVSDFWRYMVIARNVTLATPTAKTMFTLEAEQRERRAKKRGSSNTDTEKSFRWFYNFGHEGEKRPSEKPIDQRGIRIECNGKQRDDDEA